MSEKPPIRDVIRLIAAEEAMGSKTASSAKETSPEEPFLDEMTSYLRGELEDEAHLAFQEMLIRNPQAARQVAELARFEQPERFNDVAILNDIDFKKDQARLRRRIAEESAADSVASHSGQLRLYQSLAAMLAVACLGLLLLRPGSASPTLESTSAVSLLPVERESRGTENLAPLIIPEKARKVVVILAFDGAGPDDSLLIRIEPLDGATSSSEYSDLTPIPGQPLVLTLDPEILGHGPVRFEIFAVDSRKGGPLATYLAEVRRKNRETSQ